MTKISKDEILASSSGLVASILNFLPGIGAGYIYQRRWLQYFLTLASFFIWFGIGIYLQGDEEPSKTEQLIGITGILVISIITVIESNIAHKKACNAIEEIQKEDLKPSKKKLWFS